MASETVDPTDWLHPPPSWAVPPELHVFQGVNAAYKSQDLLHQPGLERASTGMPDQRTTCAATQSMIVALVVALQLNCALVVAKQLGCDPGCGPA